MVVVNARDDKEDKIGCTARHRWQPAALRAGAPHAATLTLSREARNVKRTLNSVQISNGGTRTRPLDDTTFLLYSSLMPATEVTYYRDVDSSVPVLEWLRDIARRDRRAAEKCIATINLLRDFGHDLRRLTADYLRDGIYELRVRVGRVQYRMLYFFHGHNAVLAHGLKKEKEVPRADIERALSRKLRLEKNPERHSYRKELSDG